MGLKPNLSLGGRVIEYGADAWRLEIPAGPAGRYRLAQLDDYGALPRRALPWRPAFSLALRARASSANIPGTWGFGLWNNPFGLGFMGGAELLRLPTLPNTAWFFFASPPNYLSLRDDLPAQGSLAATFRSQLLSPALLALGAPLLPLLLLPPLARWSRRLARHFVQQDAVALSLDPTQWHSYQLDWQTDEVGFQLDGLQVLRTTVSPLAPLGLVLWIDNQYAAWTPDGRLRYGTLPNLEAAWVEIEALAIQHNGA